MSCPCGKQNSYETCCEPFIAGRALPPNPEALMRSRYTAFAKGAIPYLKETLAPEARKDFNESDVRAWSKGSEWLGLEIHNAQGSLVDFTAKYKTEGKVLEHHEKAKFKKIGERWYFLDADSEVYEEGKSPPAPIKPIVKTEPDVGRNDPCSCGSGKKFKKCCGN